MNSGRHARPANAERDWFEETAPLAPLPEPEPEDDAVSTLVQNLAAEFMAIAFAAEHATTALDGFLAGWKAAEKHYGVQ